MKESYKKGDSILALSLSRDIARWRQAGLDDRI